MKEKLRQGVQKIKNTISSLTAGHLIVAWGIAVILFGIYGVLTKLDLRAIGFYIAGVFAAPAGLWLAWRRTRALQEQAKADAKKADALIEQAQSHAFQSETDSKRQFSEAFSRAVELLGNNNPAVRQGAIHALAGLARENSEQHRTIFNIITSYIRERRPNPPVEDTSEKLPVDIEAAMLEIVNRDTEKEGGEGYDLSNAYLRGTIIRKPNIDFQMFMFNNANLSEADLSGVNLQGADLTEANLSEVDLPGADLSGADLLETDLSRADLSGADLSGANLSGADLSEAFLTKADLTDAFLLNANLSKAFLSEANLLEANLWGASLMKANLSEADLSKADLSEADLSKADLTEADLSEVNLLEAKLHGANLSDAKNLTQEQIDQAQGDKKTILPNGIKRPDKWVKHPPSNKR